MNSLSCYMQYYSALGAQQSGSFGFGPQNGSQKRDLRQLRSRALYRPRFLGHRIKAYAA